MGLAIEGDNIGVCKAYIRDVNSLKDLALPSLFSEGNKLNLGPIPSFLPIFTTVEESHFTTHATLPKGGAALPNLRIPILPSKTIVFPTPKV